MNFDSMIIQVIQLFFVFWIMGLGFAVIIRQHRAYVHHTSRTLHWSLKTTWRYCIMRPTMWAWCRWPKQIVWFSLGCLAGILIGFLIFHTYQ